MRRKFRKDGEMQYIGEFFANKFCDFIYIK